MVIISWTTQHQISLHIRDAKEWWINEERKMSWWKECGNRGEKGGGIQVAFLVGPGASVHA
jgi:hypothetical protein